MKMPAYAGAMLAALTAAAPAAAQNRPSSTAMTCGQAQALVLERRALVLGTGGDTYDRFVRDAGFCAGGQIVTPAFAPTRDNPQCVAGWRCIERPVENR